MSCAGRGNTDAGVLQLFLVLTVKLNARDECRGKYQAVAKLAALEQHDSQPGINTMQDESPLGFC